jgi:hypothetical protein
VTEIIPSVHAEPSWYSVGGLGVPLGSDANDFCAGAFFELPAQ